MARVDPRGMIDGNTTKGVVDHELCIFTITCDSGRNDFDLSKYTLLTSKIFYEHTILITSETLDDECITHKNIAFTLTHVTKIYIRL